MTGKIIFAQEKEFKGNDNAIVKGWTFVVLNETSGDTRKYFVSNDNLKGFSPELLATIKGKNIEVSSDIKSYSGKDRVVLDKVIVLQ